MSSKKSPSTGGRRIVFTRDATGLVREISISDAVVIVFSFIVGGGIMFLSVQSLAPTYFPGANLPLGYLLALFLWLPIALIYSILARAMPRNGGDYVYVSRILGPGYGFLASWGVWTMLMFTIGALTFQAVSFGSLFVMYYGLLTYNLGLLGWSIQLTDPLWGVIFGIVVVLFLGGILMASTKGSLWIMRFLFVIPLLGGIATIWILFTHSPLDMIWAWNNIFGWGQNPFGAYGDLFRLAIQNYWWLHAFRDSTTGFTNTIGIMLIAMFAFGGVYSITIVGGEVRDTKRTFYISMVLGLFFIAAFYIGLLYPIQANYGTFIHLYDFLTYSKDPLGLLMWSLPHLNAEWSWVPAGLGSLLPQDTLQYWIQYGAWLYAGKVPFPIPASIPLFAAPLAGLSWLGLFIIGSGALWLVNSVMPMLLSTSRYMFAWSFDRIIPTKISAINERTTTPMYAIGISIVLACIGVILSYWSAFQAIMNTVFLSVPAFILTIFAATRFKARRPDLAEQTYSPKIGKIPVLSICGVIAIFTIIPLIIAGIATFNLGSLLLIIVVYSIGALIYLAMRRKNRKAGVDLEAIFKSIPPE
ncbi:MAG: APC family permease [Candidatus Freyarchaeota archaeon]|nr:APC family permease [Candidatus Jordarchaeia archaeon]MBS7269897.1 APC family permease [Candidatus Jordarchaeia archaeon]MBS7279197.1 APC family permease [Candidatus Jordarchaeia archaeon]